MEWLSNSPIILLCAIALVSFLESFALLGLLVPGVVLLFSLSAVANSIGIHPIILMIFGAAGALVGDLRSFFIGRHFKHSIGQWHWFQRHQTWLDQGEWFIKKWGWLSVSIGRFLGPLRPVIPMVAGTLGMKPKLFIPLNILTVLFWAPAYLLPGYFTGELSQLWQIQPLSTRELIVYLLTAISIIASGLVIYHHAHPERWHLKGWITRHQADRWPFTPLTLATICIIALAFLSLFPPLGQNKQFLEWSIIWQNQEFSFIWEALRSLTNEHFLTLILSCLAIWLAISNRLPLAFLSVTFLAALLMFAYFLGRQAVSTGQPSQLTGLMVFTYLTGLLANLLASKIHSLKRWPIYLLASQIILLGTLSHIWEGTLTLSVAGQGVLTAIILNSLLRATWQILNLPYQTRSSATFISLITLTSFFYALLNLH